MDLFGFLEKQSMLEQISLTGVLLNLGLSIALGFLLSMVVWWTHRKSVKIHLLMRTLVLLSLAIAGAMMIIGNNLARAFGLVGAVSIIRFRTALKSSQDMAFVFIAIVIGMASGLSLRILAIVFTALSIAVVLAMSAIRFGEPRGGMAYYMVDVSWTGAYALRSAIEAALRSSPATWGVHKVKLTAKRRNIVYRVATPAETDPSGLIAQVLSADSDGSAQLSVSLRGSRRAR